MKVSLSSICEYGNEKVSVSSLNADNYISTENMLPGKGGVTAAASLPHVSQTQAYRKGDALISNIRPYFKKIWQAPFDGGCSNDVLVFRAKNGVDPAFLYYVLSEDSFFEYATATAKGTKMPRGDKVSIMRYQAPLFPLETQKRISGLLRVIDNKMKVNANINDNLTDLLHTRYQSYFKNTALDSKLGNLSDICEFSRERIAISEISEEEYFSTENMLPNKAGAVSATMLPAVAQATRCRKGDTLISNIRPYFKKIYYCQSDCACSSDVLCFVPCQAIYSAFLFCTLYADRFFDYMVSGSKGTKMPRGDKRQIMAYSISIPANNALLSFNEVAVPILTAIERNRSENKTLSSLRDALLPRLMSGELDASKLPLAGEGIP